MNNNTYIPNLPDELNTAHKEISKLYHSFNSIITFLYSYFESSMRQYEIYHTNKILDSTYENHHTIDVDEFNLFEGTIKKNKKILSKWLKAIGLEYQTFNSFITATMQEVTKYMNLLNNNDIISENNLTNIIKKSKKLSKINNTLGKIKQRIGQLNIFINNFDSFNNNLKSALIIYPDVKLDPVNIEDLLLEIEKFIPQDHINLNRKILLNYISWLQSSNDNFVYENIEGASLDNYQYLSSDYLKNLFERKPTNSQKKRFNDTDDTDDQMEVGSSVVSSTNDNLDSRKRKKPNDDTESLEESRKQKRMLNEIKRKKAREIEFIKRRNEYEQMLNENKQPDANSYNIIIGNQDTLKKVV